MTPIELQELKEKIWTDLNRNLAIDKLKKDVSSCRACNLETDTRVFYLEDGQADQHKVLEEVLAFREKVNGVLYHRIEERGTGRVGHYSRTVYRVDYQCLIDEISEQMLKVQVHKALRSLMGLDTWTIIDCKLMQLFKDGIIEWDDLVKAHQTNCSF